jgi:ADP-heptose:LPS heptosyltransferase
MEEKRLHLRLSSLGDVILASAALQVKKADWVVSKEFAELLVSHPSLGKLWCLDRKQGLRAWFQLCRMLWEEKYTHVYDLHGSLRTRLMKVFFLFWSLFEGKRFPQWKSVSKQRGRFLLYLVLKKRVPRSLRPQPWIYRHSKLVGGTGQEKPDLRYLVGNQTLNSVFPEGIAPRYLCVMPSSKWDGKKWPISHYLSLLHSGPPGLYPVILGAVQDRESRLICEKLVEAKVPHFNGVGRWTLKETAAVLASSQGYLGNDTGLAHLAQAVGVPAVVIFGPTVPDLGFGPWGEESEAIGIDLACRPCGKDGRFCYRFHQPYQCLKGLSPDKVAERLSGGGKLCSEKV